MLGPRLLPLHGSHSAPTVSVALRLYHSLASGRACSLGKLPGFYQLCGGFVFFPIYTSMKKFMIKKQQTKIAL